MNDKTTQQFLQTVEVSIEALRGVRKTLKSGGAYHDSVDHEVRRDLGYVWKNLGKLLNLKSNPRTKASR